MPTLSKRIVRLFRPPERHLLRHLIIATLKTTDQATFLGMAWSLIMPLFFTVVMFFLFRNRFSTGGAGYALFIMVGVSTVGFFLNSISTMLTVLLTNRDLILNTTVPRELLFLANMANALMKYGIEIGLAFLIAVFLAEPWWLGLPLMIPVIAALCGLVLGIGMVLGLLACVTRDVQYFWTLVARVLLFATPVFYSLNMLSPVTAKIVYFLNPLSSFLIVLRAILIGKSPGHESFPAAYAYCLAVGFGTFLVGYLLFLRYEYTSVERA